MGFVRINDKFSVETVESNKRDKCGDYVYFYKIISSEPEDIVKEFCINNLHPKLSDFSKDNLFSPEIEFKNATNLGFPNGDIYHYKIKKFNTN